MLCACFITEGTSMCITLPIRVPLIAGDSRGHWLDQHGGMATVAEAPTSAEINREGALMVTAVNGTIGPESFPALDYIDQVAGRHEVNGISPSRQTSGDGHLPTSLQAERRCLPSFNLDKVFCSRRWRKRTL